MHRIIVTAAVVLGVSASSAMAQAGPPFPRPAPEDRTSERVAKQIGQLFISSTACDVRVEDLQAQLTALQTRLRETEAKIPKEDPK